MLSFDAVDGVETLATVAVLLCVLSRFKFATYAGLSDVIAATVAADTAAAASKPGGIVVDVISCALRSRSAFSILLCNVT